MKLRSRKAQIALEFISTYGFALVILAVVLAAISYSGIFNFSSLQANECNFPQGAECVDFALAQGDYGNAGKYLQIVLYNSYGADLTINNSATYVTFDKAGNYSCITSPDANWASATNRTIACRFPDTDVGLYHPSQRYTAVVTLGFKQTAGTYQHTIKGSVSVAAQ